LINSSALDNNNSIESIANNQKVLSYFIRNFDQIFAVGQVMTYMRKKAQVPKNIGCSTKDVSTYMFEFLRKDMVPNKTIEQKINNLFHSMVCPREFGYNIIPKRKTKREL